MNCFPCLCFSQQRPDIKTEHKSTDYEKELDVINDEGNKNISSQAFTFRELATATKNFRQECLLGEGGFGRVYKGQLKGGKVAAVKLLDRNGMQGNKEFLVEVLMLSLLHHPNLVNLIGYCADGEQRLLVYEFMPQGSLEDHLLDLEEEKQPLDWFSRMKIAAGAARGLEYLHVKAKPPVIYRDLKPSNILLDEEYNPKLSDFGLAKLGPIGDKIHVSSRVMGTYGYCAPEYTRTGQVTTQSDVYSFGIVLLELITGRRVIDPTRPTNEQNLVAWAQPIFRDARRFCEMADPLLKEEFPERGLKQAVAIAAMCLQDEEATRPLITDVVTTLDFLCIPPAVEDEPQQYKNEIKYNSGRSSSDNSDSRGGIENARFKDCLDGDEGVESSRMDCSSSGENCSRSPEKKDGGSPSSDCFSL